MRLSVDELVITEENKDAFEKVIFITQEHDEPQFLFLSGPSDSGKTTLMVARSTTSDLSSKKSTTSTHAAEILMALTVKNPFFEERLDAIGMSDVLFVDNIEGFLENRPLGPRAFKLLVATRRRTGLDTVVASSYPVEAYDADMREALEGFSMIDVPPLSPVGRIQLAQTLLEKTLRLTKRNVVLSPDALAVVANKMAIDCCDIERVIAAIVDAAPNYDSARSGLGSPLFPCCSALSKSSWRE